MLNNYKIFSALNIQYFLHDKQQHYSPFVKEIQNQFQLNHHDIWFHLDLLISNNDDIKNILFDLIRIIDILGLYKYYENITEMHL